MVPIWKNQFSAEEFIHSAQLILSPSKCEFTKTLTTFLGHVINYKGISSNPQKLSTLQQISQPTIVIKLQRFMGVVNQFGKVSPNVAELSIPSRKLLSTMAVGPSQEPSFTALLSELTNLIVLKFYDLSAQRHMHAELLS